MFRRFLPLLLAVFCLSGLLSARAASATAGIAGSPKLLGLFLDWEIKDEDVPKLARWDVVVLDADQQARFPEKIRRLRELNPKIKILAYVTFQEIAEARFVAPSQYPMAKLAAKVRPDWYLVDPAGGRLYFWPHSPLVNVTDISADPSAPRWNQMFPLFAHQEILSNGLWDGLFLDNAFEGISSYVHAPIDLNRDGRPEDPAIVDAAWREGMRKMIGGIRTLDPNAILIGNGGAAYAEMLNGVMFEHFPRPSFNAAFPMLRDAKLRNIVPSVTTVNLNTDNAPRPDDYRLMRYGLATALVADAYYSFDQGDKFHSTLWWYDEYEVSLGKPKATAKKVIASCEGVSREVWTREYEKGMVVLNPSDRTCRIKLPGEYRRLQGTQDPKTNSGASVHEVTLSSEDGLLLLKPLPMSVPSGVFLSSGPREVLGAQSGERRGSVTVPALPAGQRRLQADLDGDGKTDIVIQRAADMRVTFGEKNKAPVAFFPFGKAAKGVSCVVVRALAPSSPAFACVPSSGRMVSTFSLSGASLSTWTVSSVAKSVQLAAADLDGDGNDEILTLAAGDISLKSWTQEGTAFESAFQAMDPGPIESVRLASGDVDGDRVAEILVAVRRQGTWKARTFNRYGMLLRETTLPLKLMDASTQVRSADVDGDGRSELVLSR